MASGFFMSLPSLAKILLNDTPSAGNITEEKESELEEFIEYAIIVMGTLGHKVFEPLSQAVITNGSISHPERQIFFQPAWNETEGVAVAK
jgi:hypothetical protein